MATGNAKQKLSCLKWEAVKASEYNRIYPCVGVTIY